jgi:hypothetical protein
MRKNPAKSAKPTKAERVEHPSPIGKRSAATAPAGEQSVTIDRRVGGDRRRRTDRRVKNEPVEVERRVLQRRAKVNRRRQIDPTTCERDYTSDELEFMTALDQYKRRSGRMFPTCSEVLEVLRGLGYVKRRERHDNPPDLAQVSLSQAAPSPLSDAIQSPEEK